ncbi:MAG: hypothetical protein J0I32_09095 [Sphingobacteriales bacterium]|nr:hypothetical protein [Sphingobacteriales bacterium]OJW00152.1 MAG: hypothetical protein BGO52_03435 [Sphingobacteriales bacterium 44-61]
MRNKLWLILPAALSCILTSAQPAPSTAYLDILKKGRAYDTIQADHFPAFTYQSSADADLTELRNFYHLDSVAGHGTDISRAINLLQWMHLAVPHEDEYNLPVLTARNIIKTYKEKHIAQGCYPLAIAMNEIFLSMGFHSRIVICFAASFDNPNGGHVINSVYIPSLRKSLWMDPQFNVFLKDGAGNFLSIAEVRENLIAGKKVNLNKNANYHGKSTTAKYYLEEFMTEHLYRFISPLESKYNGETRAPGKTQTYLELIPKGGAAPSFGTFETHTDKNGSVKTYHTTNAALFWKTP